MDFAKTKDFADPDQAWLDLAKQFSRLCRHVGQVWVETSEAARFNFFSFSYLVVGVGSENSNSGFFCNAEIYFRITAKKNFLLQKFYFWLFFEKRLNSIRPTGQRLSWVSVPEKSLMVIWRLGALKLLPNMFRGIVFKGLVCCSYLACSSVFSSKFVLFVTLLKSYNNWSIAGSNQAHCLSKIFQV